MIKTIEKNNTLLQLFLILKSCSSEVMLVGGCVRDYLTNLYHKEIHQIKDFDIVCNGNLDDIKEAFASNNWQVNEAGKNFLVMIVSKNEQQFEIALYRKDGTYTDGRRPDSTSIGTIFDDANRRDFTVNALYYDIVNDKIIDPTGLGLEDIKSKKLRFVGKAKDRISEDKLRIMRAYRFSISKGFKMDDKTHSVCRQYFEDMIKSTPAMRIMAEMDKML
jgi:tRNA nucleotidyltransferase/poly(A) polymerase